MNINNVIARAQRLMLDENFQRDVERAASAQRGSGMNKRDGNDLADLDAAIFGVSSQPQGTDIYQKNPIKEGNYNVRPSQNYNGVQILQETREKRDPRKSGLPAAVIESFEKVPYQGDAFDYNSAAASVIDGMPKQVINEQQYQQPSNYGNSGVINYDTIKYIVNEAVKEALKGRLNESIGGNSFKGMRIAEGNIIQFLDNKGNVYEGKSTLKKRAAK